MTKELFQKPAKLLIGEVPRVGQTSDQPGICFENSVDVSPGDNVIFMLLSPDRKNF